MLPELGFTLKLPIEFIHNDDETITLTVVNENTKEERRLVLDRKRFIKYLTNLQLLLQLPEGTKQ